MRTGAKLSPTGGLREQTTLDNGCALNPSSHHLDDGRLDWQTRRPAQGRETGFNLS